MSRTMQEIEQLLEHVAPTKTPVLFLGEQGVGKEYYARFLHSRGSASPGLFCSIPAKTLNSGMFTQIMSQKPETLFFTEISGLSAEMQRKVQLLAAEFPVRISASSTQNLEALKDAGLFLPELYAVFSAFSVVIPPLRQRLAEICVLAVCFLEQFCADSGKILKGFAPQAMAALRGYGWPGNVRELRDTVFLACRSAAGEYVESADLRFNSGFVSDNLDQCGRSLKEAVDAFKKQYVLQILAETRWNKTEAAKILEIERTYLSRLIRELHI